ncbi:hypothetical protein OS493_016945 [Desmophyllum pertusum]|uniref:EGF-like domain-containing protein n=1 Tax=Desmophyllum pertusum TaxID=174260 RepID=A0A9W9YNX7_9CNID|nr:hypothetical protein OS493_016945 [Desmophyllum pertusum]
MKKACKIKELYHCGFIIIWGLTFQSVFTEDRCRTLHFRENYPDSTFNKSIIQNLTVDSEDNCQVACFIQPACKSYNLGPPDGQGKRVCELSSSRHFSHSHHLVSRPSFIYRPSVDWCQSPCPDNKTCFPDGAAGYFCFCTDPGFQGERCDEGFPFHWTLNGSDPFVSLYNEASYKTTDGRTVLYLEGNQRSYAETPSNPNPEDQFQSPVLGKGSKPSRTSCTYLF